MAQELSYQLVDSELVRIASGDLSLATLGYQTCMSDDFPNGAVALVDGAIEVEAALGSASKIRIERTG